VCHESRLNTTACNYTKDEGRPLEAGSQVLVSSHRRLLRTKAAVVSVAETPGDWEIYDYGDSARSSRAVIIVHRDVRRAVYGVSLTACGRKIGGDWRRWRIPKWRASVGEGGQYCFAVALRCQSQFLASIAKTATTRDVALRLLGWPLHPNNRTRRAAAGVTAMCPDIAPFFATARKSKHRAHAV
jgi:hypothetical protein